MNNERRFLLKVLGISAVLPLSAYSVSKLDAKTNEVFLRPPGALDERDFISRCLKCGQCIAICPQKAISPLIAEKNFKKANTPIMIFQYAACDLCKNENKMLCIKICPTGALSDIQRKDVRIGIAKIIKENCIAWQSTGCSICKDACPEKAIELTPNALEPIITENLCNGCGICQKICPTSLAGSYKGTGKKGVIILPNKERL